MSIQNASPESNIVVNFSQVASALGDNLHPTEAINQGLPVQMPGTEPGVASAVLSRALASLQDAETLPGVFSAATDQAGALLQTFLAEQAVSEGKVSLVPETGVLEAKFDSNDWWGWMRGAGWNFIRSKLGLQNRVPFPALPTDAVRLSSRVRLAILGDWGTGLYGAPLCATSIARDRQGFAAVVHLGDVYYSGSQNEVQQNFLNHWPWLDHVVNRACNSNHEMYGGGGPYLNQTLTAFNQGSSVFRFENDDWVIVGLDTAYDEHELGQGQGDWLGDVVSGLMDRRLVLFSHHQLYSHLSGQGPKLQTKLRDLLDKGSIFAWYWGHEHLLAIYDAHPKWRLHARCVGHSGYPYFRPKLGGNRESLPDGHQLVE